MSIKRRYCIFAAQYFPHLGGVERYTYNLSKKLVELGNDVTIVTSNVQHLKEYEKMEGISVYRMPCYNMLNGRYPVLKFNRNFFGIHRILREKNFDFVIVNTRFYVHSIYGQWFAKSQGTRVITIDHGTSHLSVNNKVLDYLGGYVEHAITRIGRLFCSEYYGVSKACTEWLKHFHIKAEGVLYNSVELDDIQEILANSEKKYRKQYGIKDDAIVITFTGRLLPEKGISQLITAMKKINRQKKDVYLFIAGDGDLEDYVNDNRTENIIPVGRLSFEEIIKLLSESDIFCLPSFSEGFSTSILEAISCKCIVVTTERGGARETFPTDDYGMVIKNNEVDLLEKSLISAIEDEGRREKAVQLAYDRLKENYTWDIVAAKVNQL